MVSLDGDVILVTCNGQTFYINVETKQEQVSQKVAKKDKSSFIYNIANPTTGLVFLKLKVLLRSAVYFVFPIV